MLDDAIDLRPDIPRITQGLRDVARRRLFTAPDMLDRIAEGLYDDPRILVHVDQHIAVLSLYPGREEGMVRERIDRYGTPYPNLYTLDGVSETTGHHGYEMLHQNQYMIAHPNGNTIEGGVIFHLFPDCSFTLERMSIRTSLPGGEVLEYPTHLLLMIRFGERFLMFDAVRDMDDLATQHVFASRLAAEHYAKTTQSL
ncbi:hypothetical protein N825_28910 [Skermanella stibiiresistens SB22]|uniref:Uncharacterized protein n=1 Tax=Skermanella stibiiresistens SB22 TaxID=1385369 RepID=W9GQX6_9PROT|nr:hypothetical protein [Skermanella stibiiresistens]EWY36295.1 hypothetical protein N825_28910 [Skermanella stibiiresistens SB22]